MSFDQYIQKWVSIDNKIKVLNEKAKELKQERNNAEEVIIKYVNTNGLSNAVVNISDGKLKFGQTKQVSPLTLKYVEACLSKCINNADQVELIMNYIKSSREISYEADIKRTYSS
jgi:hypothetical protein